MKLCSPLSIVFYSKETIAFGNFIPNIFLNFVEIMLSYIFFANFLFNCESHI